MESDRDGQISRTKLATSYQMQECVLYGSVLDQFVPDLERRLVGLCDPGSTEFHEHEMSFSLKTGNDPDVCLRLRRRFNVDTTSPHHNVWQYRYIGSPEPDTKCPTIVRKVIDSVTFSNNMMEFVKTIGLRMDYEFIAKGTCYTFNFMKILVYSIQKTEKAGNYDNLKRIAESHIIEVSWCIPDGTEYAKPAKELREFCDQLLPLVEMQKVDYFRK